MMPKPDLKLRVSAEARVAPSEDPNKVKLALQRILGESGLEVDESPTRIRATTEDAAKLTKLHDQLRDRHVRAAARRLLLSSIEGSTVTLMFNRQAAYAGVLALCGSEAESPLGPIYVTLESKQLEDVIEWLTAYETG